MSGEYFTELSSKGGGGAIMKKVQGLAITAITQPRANALSSTYGELIGGPLSGRHVHRPPSQNHQDVSPLTLWQISHRKPVLAQS